MSGDTGLLVPPGDRGALTSAVAELVGDAELRRRLGDGARERCRAMFDIRRVAPMYHDVYEVGRQGRLGPATRQTPIEGFS